MVGQILNRGRRASPRLPRASRVFWFGEAVSLLGTATKAATLLSLLAATQLDAGPGWMGILAAASWSPWLILGLPAGALADRWSPRTTMIVSDLVAAAAAATVPLLWVTGTLTLAALIAVAFVIGPPSSAGWSGWSPNAAGMPSPTGGPAGSGRSTSPTGCCWSPPTGART
ncbi:hypothetical protein E1258_14400 [Micromonospora sp. KC207]|nr:hypothetical protein E1258_14400 [Micromonospora sp. KC207]